MSAGAGWRPQVAQLRRPMLPPLMPAAPRQRSSFLPSYIIDVRALDEKLLNIVDLQVLHGYYEPTLLILFEPNQTWPG